MIRYAKLATALEQSIAARRRRRAALVDHLPDPAADAILAYRAARFDERASREILHLRDTFETWTPLGELAERTAHAFFAALAAGVEPEELEAIDAEVWSRPWL